jgi:hypothetical protein
MRALTMDEVLFVSGGETVVVPGVRNPRPPVIIEGALFNEKTLDQVVLLPVGEKIDLGALLENLFPLQDKAIELLNDPTIIKEQPYKVGDDTMTEMTDQPGNKYQITDKNSDGWYDGIRKKTPAGGLFQWGPARGSIKWTWNEVK